MSTATMMHLRDPANRAALEAELMAELGDGWEDVPLPDRATVDGLFDSFRMPEDRATLLAAYPAVDLYQTSTFLREPEGTAPPREAVNRMFRDQVMDPFVAEWRRRARWSLVVVDPVRAGLASSTHRLAPGVHLDRPVHEGRAGGLAVDLRPPGSWGAAPDYDDLAHETWTPAPW